MHLTGELSPGPDTIVYEYAKTRHSDHPKEYYRAFTGILMTDGLEQYHKIARERLKIRQTSIRPLLEEYFTWAKETLSSGKVLPKSKTAQGLNYSINQEEYLKVFLTDGECPIDDSASERALRNFIIDRKNRVIMNTIRGAEGSAIIYSITETARKNGLNVYYYIRHLLTELMKLKDIDGNIDTSQLEPLMPWSTTLPKDCYSKRRK